MAKLLGSPKALSISIAITAVFVVSILGGALGNSLGFGFLSSSLPAIQLPAEIVVQGFATPVGDWNLMNTMVTTWLAIIVLFIVALFVRRGLSEIPGRLQALFELIMEFFLNLCEGIAGPEKGRRFFPLVFTIFIFIVVANWMGVLPGFGTVGRVADPTEIAHHHGVHDYVDPAADDGSQPASGHEQEHSGHLENVNLHVFTGTGGVAILQPGSLRKELTFPDYEENHGDVGVGNRAGHLVPFLRSANTDVNMTLAMALIAMVMVHYWGLSILGPMTHLGKFINFKDGPTGFFVGILETISEFAKIISFTFRLFGNIFAGEVLLMAMGFLLPMIGIIPFLGLELFVGLIQALIFSMLTLVFASMASVSHGDEQHH